MDQKPSLLFFSHIPKTGGQTSLQALKTHPFNVSNTIYVRPGLPPDVPQDRFSALAYSDFDRKIAIFGHLTVHQFLQNEFCNKTFNDGLVRIISIVREPISRLCSLYNYLRANLTHPNHNKVMEVGMQWFSDHRPLSHVQYLMPITSRSLKLDECRDTELVEEILRAVTVLPIEKSENTFLSAIAAFLDDSGIMPNYTQPTLALQNSIKTKWRVSEAELVTPEKLKDYSEKVYNQLAADYALDALLHKRALINQSNDLVSAIN